MFEVPACFEHGSELVVAFEFVTDDRVPEAVIVFVVVDGEVGCTFLPHFVHLWRFWVLEVFVLVRGLTS